VHDLKSWHPRTHQLYNTGLTGAHWPAHRHAHSHTEHICLFSLGLESSCSGLRGGGRILLKKGKNLTERMSSAHQSTSSLILRLPILQMSCFLLNFARKKRQFYEIFDTFLKAFPSTVFFLRKSQYVEVSCKCCVLMSPLYICDRFEPLTVWPYRGLTVCGFPPLLCE
jgi:hypothetical protein